jgi:hypothetical protein
MSLLLVLVRGAFQAWSRLVGQGMAYAALFTRRSAGLIHRI